MGIINLNEMRMNGKYHHQLREAYKEWRELRREESSIAMEEDETPETLERLSEATEASSSAADEFLSLLAHCPDAILNLPLRDIVT